MSEPRSRDGGRYECERERVRATDTGNCDSGKHLEGADHPWVYGETASTTRSGPGLGCSRFEGYTRGTVTSETLEKRVL